MDNVRVFLTGVSTLRVDGLQLATGIGIFLIAAVLLYKRGFWPWLPLSLSGVIAAGEKILGFSRGESPYPWPVKMDLLPALLKRLFGFSSGFHIILLLFTRRAYEDQRCPEGRFPKTWV
jgi:hypothetical protein